MMKSAKKQKKGSVSEEDMSNLLHRYPAQKVLALLQEVFQSADAKMDWDALVKKTATGIVNPKEYQMLWRHIAYNDELLETVDDGAEPMDDDSDLEYELEAYPAVSAEASAEAAACVKVLIGSGMGDSKVPNGSTVEAPLTINIPNTQSMLKDSQAAALQGTNITVPVSVQKLPVPQVSVQKQSVPAGVTGEGTDVNGPTNAGLPPRRKRKTWSDEEDLELIAAVRKCGEGNWANILKGDFKGDRTASQLSQRWAILRKKQNNPSVGAQGTGPQLSEVQLATNRALNMAFKDNMITVGNGAAATTNPATVNPSNEDCTAPNTSSQPQQSQSNPAGANPLSSTPGTSSSVPNPRAPVKKAPVKPVVNLDSSMVTKVAVAAGARIASPSDAASLFKAAQANNAIHIMPKGGTTLMKSVVASNSNSTPSTTMGPSRTTVGSQPIRTNVVRPTAPSTSTGTISQATGSQPMRNSYARPTILPPPSNKPTTSSMMPGISSAPLSRASQSAAAGPSSQAAATSFNSAKGVETKKEEKTQVMKAPPLPRSSVGPVPKQNNEAQRNPTPISSGAKLTPSNQVSASGNPHCSANTNGGKSGTTNIRVSAVEKPAENRVNDLKCKQASLPVLKNGGASNGKQEEIARGKPENLASSTVNCNVKPGVQTMPVTEAQKSEQKEQ